MEESKALCIINEFFAAVEHCGKILTWIETSPEIYKAIKESEEFSNGRLWSAKVSISENLGLETCRVREVL
jgi:hypothetical protein